jgi:hypothetical protein
MFHPSTWTKIIILRFAFPYLVGSSRIRAKPLFLQFQQRLREQEVLMKWRGSK